MQTHPTADTRGRSGTHCEREPSEWVHPEVEAQIRELEQQMPHLYRHHVSVFELASAWAERYDRILAMVPAAQRPAIEARLARIGIRWGVMPGTRVTVEFRASDVAALARARRHRGLGAASD